MIYSQKVASKAQNVSETYSTKLNDECTKLTQMLTSNLLT